MQRFINKRSHNRKTMVASRCIYVTILVISFSFLSHSQEVNTDWIKSFGDIGDDLGRSLAIDYEGNLIHCGHFSADPTIILEGDSISINSNGAEDIFLKKWTNEGDLIWAKNYGGIGNDRAVQIATQNNGDIYMVGYFSEQIIFDSTNIDFQFVSEGLTDAFFGKWNANGDLLWVKHIGGNFNDEGSSLAIDNEGNVYFTGFFQGSCDFNPGSGNAILSSNGTNDSFVVKFDSEGVFLWVKQLSGPSENKGNAIIVNQNQEIVLVGIFVDSIDVDPGINENYLTENSIFGTAYIVRLSSDGEFIWSGHFNSPNGQVRLISMAQDPTGNILLVGFFRNEADLNPSQNVTTHIAASGISGDICVIKLDMDGEYIWSKQMGGTHHDVGLGITTDYDGEVYITGCYQGDGESDFDPGVGTFNLTAIGQNNDDIFVSKLSSQGIFRWAKSMNGPFLDIGFSIVTDINKNIYYTGVFGGELVYQFSPDTLFVVSNGMDEMFLTKLIQNDSTSSVSIVNLTKINIYPNPANSFLQSDHDIDSPMEYTIFDVSGIICKQSTFSNDRINISDLSPGSYFIRIKSTSKTFTSKFLKL